MLPRVLLHFAVAKAAAWWALAVAVTSLLSGTGWAQEPAPQAASPEAITTIGQFWQASNGAKDLEYPLRLRLTINHYDPEWRVLWVDQDGVGSYLTASKSPLPIKEGQIVELEGVARPGRQEILWDRTQVRVVGTSTNQPVRLTGLPEEMQEMDLKRVVAEGLVDEQVEVDPTHARLNVVSEGWSMTVYLRLERDGPVPQYLGAQIRLEGLLTIKRDPVTHQLRLDTWVSDPSQVEVVGWLSEDPRFGVELTLAEQLPLAATNRLVRIAGVVRSQEPGVAVVIRDDTGQVRVLARQTQLVPVGAQVEAIGLPIRMGSEVVLASGRFRRMSASAAAPPGAPRPVVLKLRLAEQVHGLRSDDAALGQPVSLRGVVTWSSPESTHFFLQDGSGGVRVDLPSDGSLRVPEVGMGLSVTAVTIAGSYVPAVLCSEWSADGNHHLLPTARPLILEEARTGAPYADWCEIRGYLRSVGKEGGQDRLEVATPGGEFAATLPGGSGLESRVGSVIRLKGVCDVTADARRRLKDVVFRIPEVRFVEILEEAPADAFAIPQRTVASLRQFGAMNGVSRRIRVSGVVLVHRPGRWFYLLDGEDSLLVLSRQETPLRPGDTVDTVGLPGQDSRSLTLRDAVYRRTGAQPEPQPVELGELGNPSEEWDGHLVRLRGTVAGSEVTPGWVRLDLQQGRHPFGARWEGGGGFGRGQVEAGSLVDVTGVYRLRYDEYAQAVGFEVALRSGADLSVVQGPPWWTLSKVFWVSGALLAAVLATVAWGTVLARKNDRLLKADLELRRLNDALEDRVRERTAELEQEVRERKQSEDALLVSNRRFEIVAETTTDVVWDWDVETDFVWWNSNFQRVLGYFEASPVTRASSWRARVRAEDAARVQRSLDEALTSGSPTWSAEYRFLRADGSDACILDRARIVRDRSGRPVRLIGAMQDVTARKSAEAEVEKVHRQLVLASRQAGMAEVATGVLHNVGNVLNSVNVSAALVTDVVRKSKAGNLARVVDLLDQNSARIGDFITSDPRGREVPGYLRQLADQLTKEHGRIAVEMDHLGKNVEHVKEIVAMQQNYAKVSGVVETLRPADLVEDALRINEGALARHAIEVHREFDADAPSVNVDRHKVLQILVNLIRNAKHACDDSGRDDKRMDLRIRRAGGSVRIEVQDNGVGIPEERLVQIFAHGFTTRKNGHGFGLHSAALAARELGGSLTAQSDGPGKGALFSLEIPVAVSETLS